MALQRFDLNPFLSETIAAFIFSSETKVFLGKRDFLGSYS